MPGKGEGEIGSALASAYGGGRGYGAGRFPGSTGVGGGPTPTSSPGGYGMLGGGGQFSNAPTPTVRPPVAAPMAAGNFTTPALTYGPIYWQQMAQAQADAKAQAAAASLPGVGLSRYSPGGDDYQIG
jgi:hypothetical protein